MSIRKKILYLIILLFIITQKIICTKSVSLVNNVTAKVLDRATGNFYAGLGPDLDGGQSGLNAIMVLPRYNGYGNPTGITVVPQNNSLINSLGVELLTLSKQQCSTKPILITTALSSAGPLQQTAVLGYSSGFATNNKSASSGNINDATAAVTSGIIALAANANYAYAAVKPSTPGSLFGQSGSGLAAIKITNNTNINGSLLLTQTNAQIAPSNIKEAKPIDTSIDQLKINTNPTITDPIPTAVLEWDEILQRLYIGLSQITTDINNAGAKSIIVANSQNNGVVNFENIAPDTVLAADNTESIVGALTSNANYLTIGVKNLKIMHTSTGKSYLIINGGNAEGLGTIAPPTANIIPGNNIYALPLVNNSNSSSAVQGTLANYNDQTFTTHAINSTDILTSSDIQSKVGAGPLPLLTTPIQTISDMVVVGDTVFVSSSNTQAPNTESGIFYSQAMFDEYGRIYRWTPWTKRAFPYNSSNGSTGIQEVSLFDVDAANGKIWAVQAINSKATETVFTNNWDCNSSSKNPQDLLGILNKDFKCGCFCHLDLDQSTMGLAEQSPARYALMGGLEQVAFIRTSTSFSATSPYDKNAGIPYAQFVIQDFSLPENYLLTELPVGSGCVKVLEYSRSFNDPSEQKGYFFAGTQSGLYVFADDENNQGFAVGPTVNTLNNAPFTNSSWKKVRSIPGAIIDMVSSGNALYILTFQTSLQNPIINTLYKINFKNTTTEMFDPSNLKIIAQNATSETNSDLSLAKMFYAISVTTAQYNNNFYEQILLATNNGIYRSNKFSDFGVNNANNQSDAIWAPIDVNDTNVYTNIFSVDNPNIIYESNTNQITAFETVWPIQLTNANNCKTYEQNNITQVNGSVTQDNPTFDPENFNAQIFACTGSCPQGVCQQTPSAKGSCQNSCLINSATSYQATCATNYTNSVNAKFDSLDPINYFWSDGARRFFIMKKTCDRAGKNKLFVIPYDIQQWMVSDPKTQVITDKALQNINNFYWLGPIGATGIILAGTNTGLVALE